MEHRLVLWGDTSPATAQKVIDFARTMGFMVVSNSYPLPKQRAATQDELAAVDLAEQFLSPHMSFELRVAYTREIHRLAGGPSAAALTQRSFKDFVQAHREGLTKEVGLWSREAAILEFMLANRIAFSDVDPAEILKTSIHDVGLGRAISNRLARQGLRWLELMQFVSEAELLKIFPTRNNKALPRVRELLAARGLRPQDK